MNFSLFNKTQYWSLLAVLLTTLIDIGSASAADPAGARIMQIDRVIAVVNDEVITQYELEERLKRVSQQLHQNNTPLPPLDILEKQVLERMISDRAQLQYAAQTGLRIDDNQLDRTIERIAEDNKLSMEKFRETVEKDGLVFAKFREEIRNEITLSRLREREVDSKIVIPDTEIESYLSSKAAQSDQEDEYNLAHILVTVPEQSSPENIQERRVRVEKALLKLKEGADFGQVSAEFSDAQNALQGGLLGWKIVGQLPSLFTDALATLNPGEITGTLRSPNGFHIVKLLGKRGKNAALVVQQTHARHILIKTNEVLSDNDAKNRLLQIKERLDNGADFAELAKQYSEDTSASKGGDLGWLSPGDTVPEFQRAMNLLKIGQISAPVQSQFGWHLIQIQERRDQDVTQERQRFLARQSLRERKSDEAYQEWLRQLRDRAYVEYRLEDKL
jgi:peptidyl-prolyl cis-trans isomerase SurA